MEERRRAFLRKNLRGNKAKWGMAGGIALSLFEGASISSWRLAVWGIALTAVVVYVVAYMNAHRRAQTEFFSALAPQLGLTYTPRNSYPPMTPLLAAGDRQRFEHTMVGTLFRDFKEPLCMLGHYTYDTAYEYEEVTLHKPARRFTACVIDIGMPIWRYRGLYLRPRISGLGLEHDWLARAPKPEAIKLESTTFNELYDLRRSSDQDQSAVRELFSPSFLVWLNDHPLRPGFECKAGTLVVFTQGHLDESGKWEMLLDAAREITRRLAQQVDEGGSGGEPPPWLKGHFSAAGQTIR